MFNLQDFKDRTEKLGSLLSTGITPIKIQRIYELSKPLVEWARASFVNVCRLLGLHDTEDIVNYLERTSGNAEFDKSMVFGRDQNVTITCAISINETRVNLCYTVTCNRTGFAFDESIQVGRVSEDPLSEIIQAAVKAATDGPEDTQEESLMRLASLFSKPSNLPN